MIWKISKVTLPVKHWRYPFGIFSYCSAFNKLCYGVFWISLTIFGYCRKCFVHTLLHIMAYNYLGSTIWWMWMKPHHYKVGSTWDLKSAHSMLKNHLSSHVPSYLLFSEDSQSVEIKIYFGSSAASYLRMVLVFLWWTCVIYQNCIFNRRGIFNVK